MVRFTGYARKEDPKWITALIYAGVALAVFLLLFVLSFFGQWFSKITKEKPVAITVSTSTSTTGAVNATSSTITAQPTSTAAPKMSQVLQEGEKPAASGQISVSRIVVTTGVEQNQPINDLAEVDSSTASKLYCFTGISSKRQPQNLKHQWVAPGGGIYADIDLTITHPDTVTWSYINLTKAQPGQWQVKVIDAAGKTVAAKLFQIK